MSPTAPGQSVLVFRSSGAWAPGTVKEVSLESVTVEMEDGQKTIPRAAVNALLKLPPGNSNQNNAVVPAAEPCQPLPPCGSIPLLSMRPPSQAVPPCGSNPLLSMTELLTQQDVQLKQQQGLPSAPAHLEKDPLPADLFYQPSFQELERKHLCRSVQPDIGTQQQDADMFALRHGLEFAAQNAAQPMQQPMAQQQTNNDSSSRFAVLPNTVPLAQGVERIDPTIVYDLVKRGACILVDVRSNDRACGVIDGAINVPAMDSTPFVAKVPSLGASWGTQPLIIFHCQYSAHRAPQCANWYREQAPPAQRVAIMDGGFRGWQSLGLPSVAVPSN